LPYTTLFRSTATRFGNARLTCDIAMPMVCPPVHQASAAACELVVVDGGHVQRQPGELRRRGHHVTALDVPDISRQHLLAPSREGGEIEAVHQPGHHL